MLPWRSIAGGALALVVILAALLVFTLTQHGSPHVVAQADTPSKRETIVAKTATVPITSAIQPTTVATAAAGTPLPVAQPTQPASTHAVPTPTQAPAPTATPVPQPIGLPGPLAGDLTVWPTLQNNGCAESWHTGNNGINFAHTSGTTACNQAFWAFPGNQTCSIWIPFGQDMINGQIWSPNTSISYGANSNNWTAYDAYNISQQSNIGKVVYLGAWSNLQRIGIGTNSGENGTLIEAGPLYYTCH